MPNVKLKTTRIITLSVAAILFSIVVLVAANFYFLNTTNENLALIENFHNRKVDIVSRLTHIVRERSLVMLAMYVEEDEWKIDEQYMKFNSLAAEFIRLRDQLTVLGLTDTEQKELDKALAVIRETEPLQDDIVEKIRSGNYDGLRTDISVKDLPLEFELLNVFNTLTNNIRDEATNARMEAQQTHRRSMYYVAIASIAITFLIIALMYRSLRKIQIIERELIDETTSLSWDATHDPLTNIHNRRWLEHKIEQLGKRESDKYAVSALIYMDLDDFKLINDKYGHTAGDHYLIAFCREIEHCIRQHDTFARFGGDEFVVLLDNCDLDNAKEIASKILERIQSLSVEFNGHELSTYCSIGLLEFSVTSDNIKDIIPQADAHCYAAKRQGKNKIYSGSKTDIGAPGIEP